MRYVRYQDQDGGVYYGFLEGDVIEQIDGDLFGAYKISGVEVPLSQVKLLAPCVPSKVIGIGRNYRSHIEELSNEAPGVPCTFIKPTTSVIGPDDVIEYPPAVTRLDYECELCVVIGKKAKFVKEEDALDYVLGYTVGNDVSARNMQWEETQWTRGKALDTGCVLGPIITDEVDPDNLRLSTRLNGEVKQDSNTENLIFKIPYLISFITEVMTLLPGDVIMTGTPAGISPMNDGDIIEVEVEDIGILRNKVVKIHP